MLLLCVLVFVVVLSAAKLLLFRDPTHTEIDGVRVSNEDIKRFAGFVVAIDPTQDEIVIVANTRTDAWIEADIRGLDEPLSYVAIPGEKNELLAKLVAVHPIVRRYDNASLN